MPLSNILNLIGLSLDIVGVLIFAFFVLESASKIERKRNPDGSITQELVMNEKGYDLGKKLKPWAIGFVIFGFLFQILGNLSSLFNTFHLIQNCH